MANTTTPDVHFHDAAVNAERLANKIFNNAVGLSRSALDRVSEYFRIAEECAYREDYVGAWNAFGGVVVTVQDLQQYSLLKTDKYGRSI